MARKKNTSSMVTVAFNHPHGMEFRLGERTVMIRGNASGLAGREKGVLPVGQFGYTRISAEDWEAIQKTYGSMAIFKNGLIFAEATQKRAEDHSDELAELRHGREAIDITTTRTEEAEKTE